MARFIGLHCEKCGKDFRIVHGPRKTEAIDGIDKDELAQKEYARNEQVFHDIEAHESECGGTLACRASGFMD